MTSLRVLSALVAIYAGQSRMDSLMTVQLDRNVPSHEYVSLALPFWRVKKMSGFFQLSNLMPD